MFVATISADRHATLAQSVERFTRNEKVAGSIPAGGFVTNGLYECCYAS